MPAFNPAVPVHASIIGSDELRDNFNALKDLIDAIPSAPRFTAGASDPGGVDGDFWFNNDIGLLNIRLSGAWVGIATGQAGGVPAGMFQPSVGYRASGGQTGGTDSLANAIANNWNVINGLLCPP